MIARLTFTTLAFLSCIILALLHLGHGAELRWQICSFKSDDSTCSGSSNCVTESSGSCDNIDLENNLDDWGAKVTCQDTSSPMQVVIYGDDDCGGDPFKTWNALPQGQCQFVNRSILAQSYLKIECYDSIIPPNDDCHAAESMVRMQDGQTKVLDQVRPGDFVESVDDNGNQVFSQVFLVQHMGDQRLTNMVKIGYSTGSITLTKDHYLHIGAKMIRAGDIRVNDLIDVLDQTSRRIQQARVVQISNVKTTFRNVHTMNDKIVVDGVVSSCVAGKMFLGRFDAKYFVGLLTPLKLMYKMGLGDYVNGIDQFVNTLFTTTKNYLA